MACVCGESEFSELGSALEAAVEVLTVSANKLKNVTLGRKFTTRPKSAQSSQKRSSSSNKNVSFSRTSAPPSRGGASSHGGGGPKKRTDAEIQALKQKHPCGICHKLGHWAAECPENPNPRPKSAHMVVKQVCAVAHDSPKPLSQVSEAKGPKPLSQVSEAKGPKKVPKQGASLSGETVSAPFSQFQSRRRTPWHPIKARRRPFRTLLPLSQVGTRRARTQAVD